MTSERDDASAAGVACTVRRWCRAQARSGSVYDVVESTRGDWVVRVDNVPNPFSDAIDRDRWWCIEPTHPWPPRLGHRLVLVALTALAFDDAERMPGGGKITSPVVGLADVTWLAGGGDPASA